MSMPFATSKLSMAAPLLSIKSNANSDQLMRWLDRSRGLWRKNDGDYDWWRSANMLTTFANLAKLEKSVLNVYGDVFDIVYHNAPNNKPKVKGRSLAGVHSARSYTSSSDNDRIGSSGSITKRTGGFQNDFYDDEGWWGLAWVAALDVTGKREYLDEAISIWYDMDAAWNKHHCGGIPWNKNGHSPVSIANGIYFPCRICPAPQSY